jgi:hypothetical protein
MLVDLIQRDCQDDNLLKTIKESRWYAMIHLATEMGMSYMEKK